MIQEISIQNFALIEKTQVAFAPGFNVLTGETGAGKSILIGALGLLLGTRADTEVIRSGADEALVSGTFALEPSEDLLDWAKANDFSFPTDEPLVIKRTVRPQKRGTCSLSGHAVTRVQLEEVTSLIVDVHGQHEHQTLFNSDQHRRLLDRYAGMESDLKSFAVEFQTLAGAKKQLEELLAGEENRDQELFRLRQVVQEIRDAELVDPDEEATLKTERSRLEQFGKLSSALDSLEEALSGGRSSAVAQLKSALQSLGAVVLVDDQWTPDEARLENALIEVEDIAQTLHRYRLSLSFSPDRLEEVQERLATLHGLDKRYGPGFDRVQAKLEQSEGQLQRLENFASERENEERRVNDLEQALIQAAMRLSERRQEAARRLETEVKGALAELGMRGAVFRIGFQRRLAESGKPVCTPYGLDQVDFLLSANAGEVPKPLKETASGGELSRVMLALKSILSEADKIPILIFDEIDTGIGGEIGLALGRYLKELSKTKQVLCITHLASIASFADHHLKVEKHVSSGRTTTGVVAVAGEERVKEVARMLSGNSVSEASLQHARELIGRHGVQR